MKGLLVKNQNGWFVQYTEYDTKTAITEYNKSLRLHPSNVPEGAFYPVGDYGKVEFEIVISALDFDTYAELKNNVPELRYKDGKPIRSYYSAKIQELLDEIITEKTKEPFILFIDDIDTELGLIEDYAKGEVGEAITKLRKRISHFYTTLK